MEGDEDRYRVARQSRQVDIASVTCLKDAEALRLPGLHGDANEVHSLAQANFLDDVVGPGTDASRGDDEVSDLTCLAQNFSKVSRVVIGAEYSRDLGTCMASQRSDHHGV